MGSVIASHEKVMKLVADVVLVTCNEIKPEAKKAAWHAIIDFPGISFPGISFPESGHR